MYKTDAPKFPQCVDLKDVRVTTINLPAFSGTQFRNGPYGAVSAPGASTGETHARCDTSLPIEDFRRAIEWIVGRDEMIRDALFASLVDHYKEGREIELDCLEDEDPNVVLPEIQNSLELLPLCGLVAVHINAIMESGDPLFGIELGCNWETDRGAGARFLGLVVDSAGDADHSFIFPNPAG